MEAVLATAEGEPTEGVAPRMVLVLAVQSTGLLLGSENQATMIEICTKPWRVVKNIV